ncbi:hypothetical protein O988_02431 [Pseudogymnoascus sp. VKM F-3808]|nr:hypothetical protein O988_02431 [Pseudogymnoascus sp. VKM F-3808]
MSLPNLFLIGASGYIGGTFLTFLTNAHPTMAIRALVRSKEQADILRDFYGSAVTPVIGSLEDSDFLRGEASKANIIVQAAPALGTAIVALTEGAALNPSNNSAKESDRPVIVHISGSSNIGHPVLGELLPRVYSDVDDLAEILALDSERIQVPHEKAIRAISKEKNVRSLIISPPTILGHGKGAIKTETFQVGWYNAIIENGASFLLGKGTNAWSTVSISDLGRAILFVVDEILKGEQSQLDYGDSGYYWVEAFEVSLMDRAKAIGERLFKEGKIGTPDVELKTLEEVTSKWSVYMGYLIGSSSRIKADRLKALGWKPLDFDWKVLVEEKGGKRCYEV